MIVIKLTRRQVELLRDAVDLCALLNVPEDELTDLAELAATFTDILKD